MADSTSSDGGERRATPYERLEALKAKDTPAPDNQPQLGDMMALDLYKATEEGDVDKFIDALEKVSESRKLRLEQICCQVTPSGNSLLHVAVGSGSEDVMELILHHHSNLMTSKNSSEDTPLHVAVRDGRLKATETLIRLGTGSGIIYEKNKDSKSPLYLAAETGNNKILGLLLEASAEDEDYAVKIQGMSPLVATFGSPGVLKSIIEKLPKLLHMRDENGGTPLHSALTLSVGNFGAASLLLERCPDLALQKDKNGSYPIHIACERSLGSDIYFFRRAIVGELLEHTWPNLAEIKNNKGQNILHVAAKAGNTYALIGISIRCVEADIKKLANSKDDDGNTPLHLASMHNHCQIMLYLTRRVRTDLGLRNNDKLTALDVAMRSKSISTQYPALLGRAILISAGVPPSKGQDVRSPREDAQWMKDEVSTRLLVATLVVTVTFAAGFTLPGGYNAFGDPRPGTATMLHNRVFHGFVIANALAMYSSILAVVVLLWGHYNDFYVAEQAYLTAGPLLLMSLTCMSVAFLAGVSVAVSKLAWLAFLVLIIAVLFLVMLLGVLGALIFPFSKTAMRIVSLYYMALALPKYMFRRLRDKDMPPWFYLLD